MSCRYIEFGSECGCEAEYEFEGARYCADHILNILEESGEIKGVQATMILYYRRNGDFIGTSEDCDLDILDYCENHIDGVRRVSNEA